MATALDAMRHMKKLQEKARGWENSAQRVRLIIAEVEDRDARGSCSLLARLHSEKQSLDEHVGRCWRAAERLYQRLKRAPL